MNQGNGEQQIQAVNSGVLFMTLKLLGIGLVSVLPDWLPPWSHGKRTVLVFKKESAKSEQQEQNSYKLLIASSFVCLGLPNMLAISILVNTVVNEARHQRGLPLKQGKAGSCLCGSFGCEVMPFILPEHQPVMLLCDYCFCRLPEVSEARQLSTPAPSQCL